MELVGGRIDVLRTATGEAAYRRCRSGGHHHHHLVCRLCRRAVEIEESPVEAWAQRVATVHGYSDVDYTLEIFGNCGECVGAPPRFGSTA
ncbi:Fur family transcriptional regulator [Pseudonocardia sichuanensis]|uniref:Fur family transcriptional regulator n=1 Tax=Pseudonocardia kunmingensis TaxID=630975 RepID=UPI003CCC76E7